MENLYLDTNSSALLASGTKYRKELLLQPMLTLASVYGKYTTRRFGVRGKETVGALSSGAQVKPSTGNYNPTDTTSVDLRELETHLGDVIEEFSPTAWSKTIYGNSLDKNIKDFDIVKAVTLAVSKSVGNTLVNALFSAKRKATGVTTMDFFDGYYTIIGKEITGGGLAASKGNLVEIPILTADNILDSLKFLYRSASLNLRKGEKVQMMLQQKYIDMYEDAYQVEHGSAPFNTKVEQRYLVGSNNRCELVPVYDDTEDAPIFITTKGNMLIGCDQESQEEKVEVRRIDNPHKVQFFMKMFFGVEFERIDKDFLIVGKQTAPVIPEVPDDSSPSDPE